MWIIHLKVGIYIVNYLFVLVLAIVGISPVVANCGNDITRKVYLGTDHFTVMSLQLPS